MQFFKTYPRCYVTRLSSEATDNQLSEGDNEVSLLYDLYLNCKVDTTTWAYRKRVLATAMRLFSGFQRWADDQSRDPNVVGYNLDFLKDTLNYIQTGTRRIGVLQWLELVTEVEEIATVHQGQQLSVTPYKGLMNTTDTIQKWMSWPNGFEDLLISLYVFFGAQRAPDPVTHLPYFPVGMAD